jgi:hypothetical protein
MYTRHSDESEYGVCYLATGCQTQSYAEQVLTAALGSGQSMQRLAAVWHDTCATFEHALRCSQSNGGFKLVTGNGHCGTSVY